jgi:hypothetical protein
MNGISLCVGQGKSDEHGDQHQRGEACEHPVPTAGGAGLLTRPSLGGQVAERDNGNLVIVSWLERVDRDHLACAVLYMLLRSLGQGKQ